MAPEQGNPDMAIRWVLYAVVQGLFLWGAIAMYQSMNSGGYHAGKWALVFAGPLAALPLLYGFHLLSRTIERANRVRQSKRRAAAAVVDQAKRAAAQAGQEERDRAAYHKIGRLVAYFVRQMRETGNPGLVSRARLQGYQIRLDHFKMERPGVDVGLLRGCWWSESLHGFPPLVLITPEGAWWYLNECIIYNPDKPGPDDESPYWWTLSSASFRRSAQRGDLYPYIPYKVWEPAGATAEKALDCMRTFIVAQLTAHSPEALHGLRAIDETG